MPLTRKVCYVLSYTREELLRKKLIVEDLSDNDNVNGHLVETSDCYIRINELAAYVCRTLNRLEDLDWKVEDICISIEEVKDDRDVLFNILVNNRLISKYSTKYDIIERVTDFAEKMKEKKETINTFDFELDERRYKRLATYCTNMCTEQIYKNEPEKVGFVKYINQINQALSRCNKNSPLILGDKGVGKTALVKQFVNCVINNKVPKWLQGYTVVNLDVQRMVSGARYRGDFEEKLLGCIDDAIHHGKIIFVLDDVHTLVGAGAAADGATDAANIIAPYITSGKLKVIATTTFDKYAHIVEQQGALTRAFHIIKMEEPDEETLRSIMKSAAKTIGNYHFMRINEDTNKLAVELSKRYMSDRKLPDSAIDLLDESCAKQRCRTGNKVLKKQYIYEVISEQLGVPTNKLTADDSDKLINLENVLAERVLGQDEAIKALSQAIRISRVNMQDRTKPLCSFIFAGSTGVGKTELCKALAEELFNDDTAITRIDMSEYMEGHSVSKLIGSPKGYIGYGEGGALTDAVAKKPYSIVLLDEIEKAHPQVMNILLQVLDDGRLTDSSNKTVDFKNTIIIMTTNAGAKKKGEDTHLGFVATSESSRKQDFLDAIKQTFKPEFLNRIDDIIVFNKLDKPVIKQIIIKLLNEVSSKLAEHNYSVTFSENVIEYCLVNGFDEENGVRPMQHFIQKNIVAYLTMLMLESKIENDVFEVDYSEVDKSLKLKYLIEA